MKFILRIIPLFFSFSVTGAGLSDVMISPQGVGPINGKTPYDQATIQKAFPDFRVSKRSGLSAGGDAYSSLLLMDGKSPVLEIMSDDQGKFVSKVYVLSNQVKNSLGPVVGSKFGSVFKKSNFSSRCELYFPDQEREQTVCTAPESKKIRYIFDVKYSSSKESPGFRSLARGKVVSIMWMSGE